MAEEQKKAEVIARFAFYQTQMVIEEGLISALFAKEPGRMSAMEMLEELSKEEPDDSAFKKLMNVIGKERQMRQKRRRPLRRSLKRNRRR